MNKFLIIFLILISFATFGCTIQESNDSEISAQNNHSLEAFNPEIHNYDNSAIIVDSLPKNYSEDSNITCLYDIKSGLCGLSDYIFPLNNEADPSKTINVYGPGEVIENNDFKIILSSPPYFLTGEESRLILTIENKKGVVNFFNYTYYYCDSYEKSCYETYGLVRVNDLYGSELIRQGKEEYYKNVFMPYENKSFELFITPNAPTLVKGSVNYFSLNFIDDRFLNPYTINFQAWIKPGKDYDSINCAGYVQPRVIIPKRMTYNLADYPNSYHDSRCCNGVFYPSFECCSNYDCISGKCSEGLCVPSNEASNKLIGSKKILVGYDFNDDDSCKEVGINELDNQLLLDVSIMESYYDHMAELLLDESSSFVNFEIIKAFKVPVGLKSSFGSTFKSESELINYLSSNCGFNPNDFDIILLNTEVSSFGESEGFALKKIEMYNVNNAATLIHETGHIFGCVDLYLTMGGSLQWSTSIYGSSRRLFPYGSYKYIENNSIHDIPLSAFQVCSGFLGWSDLNNNGIIDVKE